jgi:hypothetical protein
VNTVFCATKNFSFFDCSFVLLLVVYVLFLLIGCAGSLGISLASRVMYILCVCLRCVECRAGTILTGHFGGVSGGTVRIFLSFWLCSGGYGTVELVRGVVRFSFALFSLLSVLLAVGCLR